MKDSFILIRKMRRLHRLRPDFPVLTEHFKQINATNTFASDEICDGNERKNWLNFLALFAENCCTP